MGLEIKQDQSTAVIDVQDEMTIYTAALHWEQIQPLMAQGKSLEFNLASVSEIDSAGVQLLLAVQRESARTHNRFKISQMAEPVKTLLQLLHLEQPLTVQPAGAGKETESNG